MAGGYVTCAVAAGAVTAISVSGELISSNLCCKNRKECLECRCCSGREYAVLFGPFGIGGELPAQLVAAPHTGIELA
jgi:hypothetical protein